MIPRVIPTEMQHVDLFFLQVSPAVVFGNTITPVCPPSPEDVIPVGTLCYATGEYCLYVRDGWVWVVVSEGDIDNTLLFNLFI